MLGATKARRVSTFLKEEFCRVSERVAPRRSCKEAGLPTQISPKKVVRGQAEKLHEAMNGVRDDGAAHGLPRPDRRGGDARGPEEGGGRRLLHGASRARPSVYRGHPFQVEVGTRVRASRCPGDQPARLFRFANRVPLLYQGGGCAITKAVHVDVLALLRHPAAPRRHARGSARDLRPHGLACGSPSRASRRRPSPPTTRS